MSSSAFKLLTFALSLTSVYHGINAECPIPEDDRIRPPLCSMVNKAKEQVESINQQALYTAMSVLSARATFQTHPSPVIIYKAIQRFDEPPYPIPVGPSLYFCTLILIILAWYIKVCVWKSLHKLAERIDLYPETNKFPNVRLYSLQQSKREARLRREARNTWAWMAKNYILMPNDPKVNTSVFNTTWSDFDLPKDVWPVVRAVMKVNAWYARSMDRIKQGKPLPRPKVVFAPMDGSNQSPEAQLLHDRLEQLRKAMERPQGPAKPKVTPVQNPEPEPQPNEEPPVKPFPKSPAASKTKTKGKTAVPKKLSHDPDLDNDSFTSETVEMADVGISAMTIENEVKNKLKSKSKGKKKKRKGKHHLK